ncbi:MAG: MoxR family ATPase [Alicyclobacillus sp.]|nr:MoxR family ATPase [Alicyclobacillus sp.]
MALERPLFLEGEAGVGKTELAKAASAVLGRPLVRLQCYEGLDSRSALYEWNYPKQILHIRMMEALRGTGVGPEPDRQLRVGWEGVHPDALFTEPYLLARPLLSAIRPDGPAPVLLIDEVDRSDEAFEAFLLEVLAEYQVTIPELGTIRAAEPPLIVLTSNRTREVHDALKRRCFYHWLDFPSFEKERAIVERLVPGLGRDLATDVTAFVQRLRQEPLFKRPGLAETVNWAAALEQLGVRQLNPAEVEATIGCLLKYRDDLDLMLQPADGGLSTLQRTLAELGVPRGSAG